MKKILSLFFLSIFSGNCIAQKQLIEKCDSVQIDYVDLYVMTPVDIQVQNFYTYFEKSIKRLVIKDKKKIKKIVKKIHEFCLTSKEVKYLPDTRLIITFYYKKGKKILIMGTTLLNINQQSHILNDEIISYIGGLTNNQW